MRIGFIGAGKVGFTLGKYFAEHGLALSGYFSRSEESAQEAAEFTGSRKYADISQLIADSDAVFITVPDGAITGVYQEIKNCGISGKQLCHCSGALSAADAFPDIESHGAEGYSLHPLFPVSSKYDSCKTIGSAYFCIEGSSAHLSDWQAFFERLGNPVRALSAESKTEYHAACAVASNLVCALIAESTEMLEHCGFSGQEALSALEPLIRANVDSILKNGAVSALTGPVERADAGTVQKHLGCFASECDRELYRAVSAKLVHIAKAKHPETDYTALENLLK